MLEDNAQNFQLLLDALDAAGTIGILGFLVLAFYKGKIVPKSMVSDIVSSTVSEIMHKIDERLDILSKSSKKDRGVW